MPSATCCWSRDHNHRVSIGNELAEDEKILGSLRAREDELEDALKESRHTITDDTPDSSPTEGEGFDFEDEKYKYYGMELELREVRKALHELQIEVHRKWMGGWTLIKEDPDILDPMARENSQGSERRVRGRQLSI
ncbi:hypothetical protein ABW19_dt0208833 [Dactylella cylindrospora]|nr:hypothetical protein ABW19_dt0208833 [Dactylella cylindrospora]